MSLLALPAYLLSFLPSASSAAPSPAGDATAATAADDDPSSFRTIFARESLQERGLHTVQDDGHKIYYELHGRGPTHVVFVMGLSNTSFSWARQVAYFAQRPDEFSLLVFDNRGSGYSGYPSPPYSTSAMARDTRSLLDAVGWTAPQSVHVVGISMGGMISLEFARLCGERMRSLTLCVTSSGHGIWRNLPPAKGFETMRKLYFTTAPKDRMALAVEMLYPTAWLDQVDTDDAEGRTNRETRIEEYAHRYSLTRQQSLAGNLAQSIACLTHHVPPAELRSIGQTVPKTVVLVGDDDAMVDVANSEFLFEHLRTTGEGERGEEGVKQVEIVRWEQTGHAIHLQWPARFNALLERIWAEADELATAAA